MLKNQTDETLYQKVCAGDKKAFNRLYGRHHKKLFGFIFSLLGSREESEEVLQEVFIKIFKRRTIDFSQGSFRGWLFMIARNQSIDLLRQKQKRDLIAKNPESLQRQPLAESPNLELQTALNELRQSASKLPSPLRSLFQLKASGLTNQEIAHIEAVPVGTVKSRVHNMVKLIREDMVK